MGSKRRRDVFGCRMIREIRGDGGDAVDQRCSLWFEERKKTRKGFFC
jgi:hypothetical protein